MDGDAFSLSPSLIYLFIIIGNFPGIVCTSAAAAAYLEKEEEEEVGGGWDRGLKWYTTVDYFLRSRCYDFVICTYTRAYFALDECHCLAFFFSCLSLEIIFSCNDDKMCAASGLKS